MENERKEVQTCMLVAKCLPYSETVSICSNFNSCAFGKREKKFLWKCSLQKIFRLCFRSAVEFFLLVVGFKLGSWNLLKTSSVLLQDIDCLTSLWKFPDSYDKLLINNIIWTSYRLKIWSFWFTSDNLQCYYMYYKPVVAWALFTNNFVINSLFF